MVMHIRRSDFRLSTLIGCGCGDFPCVLAALLTMDDLFYMAEYCFAAYLLLFAQSIYQGNRGVNAFTRVGLI